MRKLSDIKIGDQVGVQTEEIIKDQTEVKAKSIQLNIVPGIGIQAPPTPNLPPTTPPMPPAL